MVLFMMFKSPTVITYHPSPERLHGPWLQPMSGPDTVRLDFGALAANFDGAQRYGTCHPKMAYLVVCLTTHAGKKLPDD